MKINGKLHALVVAALLTPVLGSAKTTIDNLKVEYLSCPIGIDDTTPQFSWMMSSDEKGAYQKNYQVIVKDEKGKEVWNSGIIAQSTSVGIAYKGEALQPATRYSWTVKVMDGKNKVSESTSWFETGLLSTSATDARWHGAKWIGGDANAKPFYSSYLPTFRIRCDIQLHKKSSRASILYGANDPRLMDANMNILEVKAEKDKSYIEAELQVGDTCSWINLYRVGYTLKDNAEKPMATFKVSGITKKNKTDRHHLELSSDVGLTTVWVDGEKVGTTILNPMGPNADFIAFPMVADVGYKLAKGEKATITNFAICNFRAPYAALSTLPDVKDAEGISIVTPKQTGATMLRSEFAASKAILKARLYVTARGIYDIFINGERISNDYFNPGFTQYNITQMYQTYDVTSMLHKGKNAIGSILNEGWWSGNISYQTKNWNYFGDQQSMMACLKVTYTDGTEEYVVTNPADWKATSDGAVRMGSFFQGEVYDARIAEAMKGWSQPNYDDSKWTKAEEIALEGHITTDKQEGWPLACDYSQFQLIGQVGTPVRAFTTLKAQSMKEVRKGVYLYDMKQNMAGVPRITFRGLKPGTKVTLRYAEVTYPDLPQYGKNVGMAMLENIRAAQAQDIYIAKGGVETYQPRYTYHGYQYVEVTGVEAPLPLADVEGVVLSSIDKITADYQSSDTLLNRFFVNTKWSSLANVFSVPTDCPQRNERMGWSGDLSVFSPAMSYVANVDGFSRRHLYALRDTQRGDGAYEPVAPIGGAFGGPLWESVGIVLPWQNYIQYGDITSLREHYASMKEYMQRIARVYINKEKGYFQGNKSYDDLGDWLGFEVMKNDNTLIFDAYYAYELELMNKMATILGYKEDAEEYARLRNERIDFINQHYIDGTTFKTIGNGMAERIIHEDRQIGPKAKGELIDTQTSYAVLLALGVVNDANKKGVVENLTNSVERESIGDDGKSYPAYSLMTGFLGTPWINFALSDNGKVADAYKMLLNRSYPSWMYPVEQGATSIWERLNSYTKQDGFGTNNHMNSFNHYAFGSVTNWLMQRSLGIARDDASPAFHHFFLCPQADPTGLLTHAEGWYDSMYGRIESSWRVDGNKTIYKFVIPANTSATLQLPGQKAKELKAGSYEFSVKN